MGPQILVFLPILKGIWSIDTNILELSAEKNTKVRGQDIKKNDIFLNSCTLWFTKMTGSFFQGVLYSFFTAGDTEAFRGDME